MEIQRKAYEKLLEWKREPSGKTAMLIEGARRVGKSTIAKRLGEREFRSFVLVDFNNVSKKIAEVLHGGYGALGEPRL